MLIFDKSEIRKELTTDNIFDLLQEWGGEPEYTDFGIISATICHNKPGEGSKKLYYYENSKLFRCYTGCDSSFDIFELTIKVFKNQYEKILDLNEAIRYIASKLGFNGRFEEDSEQEKLKDWSILSNYERIQNIDFNDKKEIVLKEYDDIILDRFLYNIKITPWLEEDITQEALEKARIGFYPGGDKITIPHFDINNRFIGLRGRSMCVKESEAFGKYCPLKVNQQWYNHPLGMNLYNLNNAKEQIRLMKKAIIFEGKKKRLALVHFTQLPLRVHSKMKKWANGEG